MSSSNTHTNPVVAAAIAKAQARLAEIKAAKQAEVKAAEQLLADHTAAIANSSSLAATPDLLKLGWQIDTSRPWNEQQSTGIYTGLSGKSFCLIGAAGTGKTSTLKGFVNSLMMNNLVDYFKPGDSSKWLVVGKAGIVLCSFTNMAVRQIAKHFTKDVICITCHKLIEFAPVYYEVIKEDGTIGKTMRFEPTRHRFNPLPKALTRIVVDEASMVDIGLIKKIEEALPNPAAVQWIFLGDLNQLPPVYGQAILGKKLLELPVIELTQVYRQALQSPIISLAHKMKNGEVIPVTEKQVIDGGEHGKVTIHPWGKRISDEDACMKAADHMKASIQHGLYDPFKDIILMPQGKIAKLQFGAVELNRNLADWMGRQRNATVYEIIAGFQTYYYAVGDKMLVNKREAIITKIQRNRNYGGKRPMNPDQYQIDRWGGAKKRADISSSKSAAEQYEEANDFDVDAVLASLKETHTEIEDRKAACSHLITVRFINGTDPTQWTAADSTDTDEFFEETILESAAEVNEMLMGYAVTIHKSQGSEWRKVWILTHHSHGAMISRELMYTAITRAQQELYIICEPDRGMTTGTMTKASKNPRLKGNTLAEKLVSLKARFDKEAAELQAKGTVDAEAETD